MKYSDIYAPVREHIELVNEKLEKILLDSLKFHKSDQVLSLLINSNAKRIRPVLVFLTAFAVKENVTDDELNNLISIALAVELIHNASLIHDDILDDEVERRGEKSINSAYGNKTALLIGDVLFVEVFNIIYSNRFEGLRKEAILVSRGMCIDELNGLMKERLSYEDYHSLIRNKTATLMELACKYSAKMVGADSKQIEDFENFGKNFGILYQLVDDYKDGDVEIKEIDYKTEIEWYKKNANDSLNDIRNSIYKDKLIDFIKLVSG